MSPHRRHRPLAAALALPLLGALCACGPLSTEAEPFDPPARDAGATRHDAAGVAVDATADDGATTPDAALQDDASALADAAALDATAALDAATADAGPLAVNLSGTVRDADSGDPLVGASVQCSCGVSTSSGAGGAWTLEVPAGALTLTFAAADHETLQLPLATDDPQQPWADVALTPIAANSYVEVIDHSFLIAHFGGTVVDAFDYADSEAGLQDYLDAVGVQYFSAHEVVTPNNPSAAASCGYDILLPGRELWERIGALALFADQLRALVGEPVYMRNWWRPPCYNTAVGGAAGGDHPDADAVDLDFLSASSRAAAQQYLCNNYWLQDIVPPEQIAPGSNLDPRLNMSVGLGGISIHLGVLSANGRRFWYYSSYTDEPDSGSCW